MQAVWTEWELEEHWALNSEELRFLKAKTSTNRLALAVLVKFFQIEGRFPEKISELPKQAISYLSKFLKISAESIGNYALLGRTNKRHRARIREFLGYRSSTEEDEQIIREWLSREIITGQESDDEILAKLKQWYVSHKIEQPTIGQQKRLIKSAISKFENKIFQGIYDSLPEETRATFRQILDENTEETESSFTTFQSLKSYPGKARLKTVLAESEKIRFVAGLNLKDTVC